MEKTKNSKGFTLAEIMVAVAVMGGLSLAIMQLTKNATTTSVKFQQDLDVTNIQNEISSVLYDPSSCIVNFGGINPTVAAGTLKSNTQTSLNKKILKCIKSQAVPPNSNDSRHACSVLGDGATLMTRALTDATLSDTTGQPDCVQDLTHGYCWIYNGNKDPYKTTGYGTSGLIINDYYLEPLSPVTANKVNLVVEYKRKNLLQSGVNNGPTIKKTITLEYDLGGGSTITYCKASSSGYSEVWSRVSSNPTDIYYASGRVGIGYGSPSAQLHVAPNAPTQTLAYTLSLFDNNATSSTNSINKTGLNIQSTGAWTGTGSVNTGLNVNVSGGTTNYAAILQGGNVGIGTTTPASSLHVNGNVQLGDTATAGSNRSITLNSANATQNLNIQTQTGYGTIYQANGYLTVGTSTANFLDFQTANTERMRVDSVGNVGIGTINPLSKLQVSNGKAYIDSNNYGGAAAISLAVGDNDTGLNSAGDGALDVYSNNVNTMSVRSGSVGVGIAAPLARLHVDGGDVRITNGFGYLYQSSAAIGHPGLSGGTAVNYPEDYKLVHKGWVMEFFGSMIATQLSDAQRQAIVNSILNTINGTTAFNTLAYNITNYSFGRITVAAGGSALCAGGSTIDGIGWSSSGAATGTITYHCSTASAVPDCRVAGNCNKLYVDGTAGNGYCMVGTSRCLTNGSNAYWGACNWASAFGSAQYYQLSSGWYNYMCPANYFQVGRRITYATACAGVGYSPASGYTAASAYCTSSTSVINNDEPYCCPARIF